jgi:hypothetical protein
MACARNSTSPQPNRTRKNRPTPKNNPFHKPTREISKTTTLKQRKKTRPINLTDSGTARRQKQFASTRNGHEYKAIKEQSEHFKN